MSLQLRIALFIVALASASAVSAQTVRWHSLYYPAPNVAIATQAANAGGTVYLTEGDRLYYSNDHGFSWNFLYLTFNQTDAPVLIVLDPTHLLVASHRRVLLVVDGGRRWQPLKCPVDITQDNALAADSAAGIFVPGLSTSSDSIRVLHSIDYGTSWIASSIPDMDKQPNTRNLVTQYAIASNKLIYAESGVGRIYISFDGGITWSARSKLSSQSHLVAKNNILLSETDRSISLDSGLTWKKMFVDGTDSLLKNSIITQKNVIVTFANNGMGAGHVYQSRDLGETWSRADAVKPDIAGQIHIASDSNQNLFANFYHSLSGAAAWDESHYGVFTDAFKSIYPTGDSLLVGGSRIYRSDTSANVWRTAALASTKVFARGPNGNVLAFDSAILRCNDNGSTWTRIDTFAHPLLSALSYAQLNGTMFFGTTNGYVLTTKDNGATWKYVYAADPKEKIIGLATFHDTIAAISDNSVYYSNDGGNSYTPNAERFGYALGTFSEDSHYFYAVTKSGGLLRSSDHGMNWDSVHSFFPGRAKLLSVPNLGLVAATTVDSAGSDGVLLSDDHGANWQPMSSGLPHSILGYPRATDIAYSELTHELYLSTATEGLYATYPIAARNNVSGSPDLVDNITISPNPASNYFTVHIPSMEHFHCSLFDARGTELLQADSKSGFARIQTSSLPSGIYLLHVTDEQRSFTRNVFVQH